MASATDQLNRPLGVLRLSAPHTRSLRAAGLDRITLSLDGTTAGSVAHMAGSPRRC
jgi:hypothetical protein